MVDPPEEYRPSEDEPYMNPRQLEYFKQKLLTWREELIQESEETLQRLKEESAQEPDMVDRGSWESDRALELRTRERYRKLINKIDAALERISRGTYGYCEETGGEIGLQRLEARPITTLSIEAQEKHERIEKLTRSK